MSLARGGVMIVALLACCLLAIVIAAWVGQRRLIYFPSQGLPAPARVGLTDAEPLQITAADGTRLGAWYVPAESDPVGAVLVLPGNAGNRAGRAPLAAALRRRGLATLLIDYRGYAGNDGHPSQEGLLADARAGADALLVRSGLPHDRLVFFGESLGSAVAAGLAAERAPAALILRSPFPDLVTVGRLHYPWLPVGVLLRDRFPTAQWLRSYTGPTLVIAGDADRIVPDRLSRQVADALVGPVESITIAGAGHNDPTLLDGNQMLTEITGFLRRHADMDVRDPASG